MRNVCSELGSRLSLITMLPLLDSQVYFCESWSDYCGLASIDIRFSLTHTAEILSVRFNSVQ